MTDLVLQPTGPKHGPEDLVQEIKRLEALLAERRVELTALQEELRHFKSRYTQIVGSRLAELAEVEQLIREAEARVFGVPPEEDEPDESPQTEDAHAHAPRIKTTLRNLFWSIARAFHPDHAADEREAQRRHSVMAEASRAYSEGDVESLQSLLGQEELHSYCARKTDNEDDDLAGRLLRLKDELRTIEFGIKRVQQDGLYKLKLETDAQSSQGRDKLAEMADGINRKIVKARRRLEHLG